MKRLHIYIIDSFYLAMLISLFVPACVLAQNDSSAVQFHGSNELVGQYSSRQGMNSNMPKDFLRNDFQMTLTVHDIPIFSSFFITTEQRDDLQRINNLHFSVDLVTLKKNRARIEASKKAKNLQNTKAPWMLRFLSNFSKIEAGRFRPDYGALTLQGISVSGVNIEFNHKIVYAAFVTGNVKRHTEEENNVAKAYKQNLIFGKFGFGEKRKTHFYLSYLHIDDVTSEPLYLESNTSLKAESNDVLGAEFRLSFLKNRWTIDGDAGVSILTRDSRLTLSYDPVFEKVPQWLVNQVNPNVSTSGDFAYGFNTKLNLKTTTLSGGFRRIGPGYITLGNPILINDRQTYEGRIDQAFLMRKISVSAYFKRFKDNLIDWKRGTTYSTAFGIIARLTLKKAPYFQISFTPNYQETNIAHLSISNHMNIFSFSTGYKYPISSKLMSFTSLSYLNQMADYKRDDTLNQYNNSQTFTLNQIFNFKTPLQINFNANYTTLKNTNFDREVISVVLSGTHTYKKKWRNTIGGKYLNSKGASHENKFSIFWDTQINIWKNGDFGLSIDENIFKNKSTVTENFNEFIVQFKLMIKW